MRFAMAAVMALCVAQVFADDVETTDTTTEVAVVVETPAEETTEQSN